MKNKVVDFLLKDINDASEGIDIFSKEYFFEDRYAKHRNALIPRGFYSVNKTRLTFLIRDGLTEEQRNVIFPSVFDLGNHRAVPQEYCTYENLVSELYVGDEDSVNANDAFETIQKSIFEITGRKVKSFSDVNKSKTYKVLKILKLLMKEYGHKSLMHLFRGPIRDKKFSLSFRHSGSYDKNQKQVFQIADLTAYLSAEISDQQFYSVKSTFDKLDGDCNDIAQSVEKVLLGGKIKTCNEAIKAYRFMGEAVNNFEVKVKKINLDLDEELFIHLSKLEFFHFAFSFEPLIEASMPNCKINNVRRELQDFTAKVFVRDLSELREIDPALSISEIPDFLLKWQEDINIIVRSAFPQNFETHDLSKFSRGVQNIVRYSLYFQAPSAQNFDEEFCQVSTWNLISAVCCLNYALNFGLNFKPYWSGQPMQSGSVISSIMQDRLDANFIVNFDQDYGLDNIPEEHRSIIKNCYRVISDALRGQLELREVRQLFHAAVVRKVIEMCLTNDIKAIENVLADFTNFVNFNVIKCTSDF